MRKVLVMLLAVLLLLPPISFAKDYQVRTKFTIPFGADSQVYTVERIIDGNTLELTNGEKVLLIGIDSPEPQPNSKALKDSMRINEDIYTVTEMGKEATQFLKSLGIEGKEVRLEFDVHERDRYGRLLAYVYDVETYKGIVDILSPVGHEIVNGNEIFLNATIIKSGYASPMVIPPNIKYISLFEKLYKEAKENKRGLWE